MDNKLNKKFREFIVRMMRGENAVKTFIDTQNVWCDSVNANLYYLRRIHL